MNASLFARFVDKHIYLKQRRDQRSLERLCVEVWENNQNDFKPG